MEPPPPPPPSSTSRTAMANLTPLSRAFRMERFCRLCLDSGQSAVHLQRLYQGAEDLPVNPELLKGIRSLVGVEITSPEDLQSAICSRCVRSLEDFFYFRNRCQAVDVRVRELRAEMFSESEPPPSSQKLDKLGIFGKMDYCRNGADGPDVYRVVWQEFAYQHRNLFDWRCEVVGCAVRMDVDKDLGDCRRLGEHDHVPIGREVFKISPAVRAFLNGLPKVGWSTEQFPCSTVAESVLNVVEYPQDDDSVPELPDAAVEVTNCSPEPEVSFFNCLERGLSMDRGGYHFLLARVLSAGGSTWHCTWTSCQVALEADSSLTHFKNSSEHSHPPPDKSVLLETTGAPISQNNAIAIISACPTSDNQKPQPEVTFYRVARSIIGVRHDGFCFRLVGFNAAGDSLWSCTWKGCPAQLELSGTLHCRLVPASEWAGHDHQRSDGPVCPNVNIISPVKALVELNGKRAVMTRKEMQPNAEEVLQGMPQLQVKLTKVRIPVRLQRQLATNYPQPLPTDLSFFRYKRTLGLHHDGRHFQLAGCSPSKSQWSCAAVDVNSRKKCPVQIHLNSRLEIISTPDGRRQQQQHHHRRYRSFPAELLNAKTMSAEDIARELKRASSKRLRRKNGAVQVFQESFSIASSVTSLDATGGSLYQPSLSDSSSAEY